MLVKIFVLNIGRNSGMHLLFQLFAIVTVLDLAKSSSCDKDVTYIRDDVFSNLRLTEGTIDTHDGVKTHAMCAVRCKRDPDCVSFFFKNKSGICQINSVIYLSTAGSESSVGSVYFRKKMECPAPPSVPNSQPQFDVISPPNATGTVLQYTCDGGYTPEGNVTCRVDGTWTQMTCHGVRCPTEYGYVLFGNINMCFKAFASVHTMYNARYRCTQLGDRLIVLNTAAKTSAINNYFKHHQLEKCT
ncbi:uncharacterized protein LOC121388706 isoform X3 [Gigantopelta aegis]|uniref:uncharacterized protein LOC121388706 isoform X3 n=1 Tax=Gigantopelta aegis TaxID=1735272 RepID=UPI001B888701|nr:uncharacterized protein LOC121388706 isoform X3 [Gigantopelta aegis]